MVPLLVVPVMTDEERDAFLLEPRLGTIGVARDGAGPLVAPIWYRYTPGGTFDMCMGETSAKAARLRAEGRCTLSVLDERGPYRNVTVEGEVTIELLGDATRSHILAMATRYLGEPGGLAYTERFMVGLADDGLHPGHGTREILVRLTPRRWRTETLG